jgi:hypothetical protein
MPSLLNEADGSIDVPDPRTSCGAAIAGFDGI